MERVNYGVRTDDIIVLYLDIHLNQQTLSVIDTIELVNQ
jgi:hypothetical protein